jgi:hypothetical protein
MFYLDTSLEKILLKKMTRKNATKRVKQIKKIKDLSFDDDVTDLELPVLNAFQTNSQSQQQQNNLQLQLQQQQQLNLQLQQQLQLIQSGVEVSKKTSPKPKSRKAKIDEEMVEVCAIVYDCSPKHPNYHLNECIDRYPAEEICGFGEEVFRDQVCDVKTKFFKLFLLI